jgi:flavin-dependent dehydrogenase
MVADASGWTWMARVRPGLYQWTQLSFKQATKKYLMAPLFLRHMKPQGRTRGADVTWRIVTESAGDGYFLAGDAAVVVDPSSSHGVLRALMSGIMVGHLIDNMNRKKISDKQAQAHYRRWLESWFDHDVRQLTGLYDQLTHPKEKLSVER